MDVRGPKFCLLMFIYFFGGGGFNEFLTTVLVPSEDVVSFK